ncbi:4,5-DOPA dioxygenase extradiol [Tepidimonas sediminis]|uniref:4,5-DOPA dioxygenase extradiol n=1 Tax=Tepidimonas sediminis TaxID=2588941 RepID=A0A554WSC0_9BURK|nr:class III extradiol ring-cleavage dioxygenase [Tepidimonas sediminis]TSE26453.1 4,5-DOPA dioxygenase extradiol [Tepidimonas sediminis]
MSAVLPTLFVSHGSPMMALAPGAAGAALRGWGESLVAGAGLRAVVVLSPHWMEEVAAVGSHPSPPTWHDFGGFPPALYRLQYPAPGDPALAHEVLTRLRAAGLPTREDPLRPRDHGAWSPLRFLLPQARWPVVQLALPVAADPAAVYALGAALADLRHDGVLLMGSGSLTHSLTVFFEERAALDDPPAPQVTAFADWVAQRLQAGDLEALLDYRTRAPHAAHVHPTDEHLLPLYFALGAAGWPHGEVSVRPITREVQYRHLAMDSYAFG